MSLLKDRVWRTSPQPLSVWTDEPEPCVTAEDPWETPANSGSKHQIYCEKAEGSCTWMKILNTLQIHHRRLQLKVLEDSSCGAGAFTLQGPKFWPVRALIPEHAGRSKLHLLPAASCLQPPHQLQHLQLNIIEKNPAVMKKTHLIA